MSFLEKWQLSNGFSVTQVNFDGNTFLLGMMEHCSAKKSVEDFTLFFKINNVLFVMKYKLNT